MSKETKSFLLITVGVFVIIAGALYYNNYIQSHRRLPYFTVNMYSEEFVSSETPPAEKIKDFNFINQKGEKVNQKSLGDCIYVADYIFTTCPGICKIMTNEMGRVYRTYKDEPRFKILSHTSKPEEDSIPVLLTYSLSKGADNPDKWLFLTGDKKELQQMAYKEYGIINPEDLQEEGSFVHTEMFVLVDKNKYIRGYYDGTDSLEVDKLIIDIKSLLNE